MNADERTRQQQQQQAETACPRARRRRRAARRAFDVWPSFARRGITLDQISGRNFVYGPGEGGIVVEYLHAQGADENAPIKALLTRPGDVTNLGDNVFRLDFPEAMKECAPTSQPAAARAAAAASGRSPLRALAARSRGAHARRACQVRGVLRQDARARQAGQLR